MSRRQADGSYITERGLHIRKHEANDMRWLAIYGILCIAVLFWAAWLDFQVFGLVFAMFWMSNGFSANAKLTSDAIARAKKEKEENA